MIRAFCAAVLLLLPFHAPGAPPSLDRLGIDVRGGSRPFVYTNKQSAFFYGETGDRHRESWEGFNVFGHEFLDDYLLIVNGRVLERSEAVRTTVYPDHLVREYPGGIIEQLRPVDSIAAIGLLITASHPVSVVFVPLFSDGRSKDDYVVEMHDGAALVARTNHRSRTAAEDYPVWVACAGKGFDPDTITTRDGSRFSPVRLASGRAGKTHILAFAVGDNTTGALKAAAAFTGDPARCFRTRRERMEALLSATAVETGNERFDHALAWAKLSLDALIMHQKAYGIFAGLPWFNNYWGRDTFIALPGACLVTGRFADARRILRSFSAFQQNDSTSPDFGRIPNLVTTTDTAYNTADGTPRFAAMALAYIQRSGDSAFAEEVYPVIARSIAGTLRYHADAMGFLTHADAETWMDAVGPDGPWSPRGNRANDIQALWVAQLKAGAAIARMVGDGQASDRWDGLAEQVTQNFRRHFLVNTIIADRLRADGSPDTMLRPNQLFTAPLLEPDAERAMLMRVAGELTYPYGVASLSQQDPAFHPWHQYEPYYPKDAAYHNGTVWTWVQGPLISGLCRFGMQDTAWTITDNSIHQILDRGAVGTQSELLDGLPRVGEREPRLSGTVSQAWNLGEFVRNFYDDYLGARLTRYDHLLTIHPHLPAALGDVRAVINMDGRSVPITIALRPGSGTVSIDGMALRTGGRGIITLPVGDGTEVEAEIHIPPHSRIRLEQRHTDLTLTVNGRPSPGHLLHREIIPLNRASGMHLAVPTLRPDLAALRGPEYPLIPHEVVRRSNPGAPVWFDAVDPQGDETAAYAYPRNPNFVPGCLDLTRFMVSADDAFAYFRMEFRALADPGWHPEYGFQLTYAAIAVDEDGVGESGQRQVQRNALYLLPAERAYQRLILVGGGVQVEDAEGKILAAYRPVSGEAGSPMGNVAERTITFAIPRTFLGGFGRNARFTVLVGAQDDHGGAGLGEFRTVNAVQGEWNGGGKTDPAASNVYDTLLTPP
jgi:hypothetical protein